MPATAASTATPSARRTHSPAPSERFKAATQAAAGEHRHGEGRGCSRGVGKQQQRRARRGPRERCAGQQQSENRPRTGRPQKTGGHAEQQRGDDAVLLRGPALGLYQPIAESDERSRQRVGEAPR